MTTDERGRLIPSYLDKLAGLLTQEQHSALDDISIMKRSIDHIKQIVAAQQGYAKHSLANESFDLLEVIEDTLRINMVSFDKHSIELTRQFDNPGPITADKHLVMQILINLISNAKKAVAGNEPQNRKLTIAISKESRAENPWVSIRVTDNGVGITPENLARIFTNGFTTSSDGHGFGLHNSANAASAMGGSLTFKSDGAGRGASFQLDIPSLHSSKTKEAAAI